MKGRRIIRQKEAQVKSLAGKSVPQVQVLQRLDMRIAFMFLLIMLLIAGLAGVSHALSGYATSFKSTYPSSPLSSLSTVPGQAGNLCTVCHGTSGPPLNPYGNAYKNAGHNFRNIEAADSDGDTFSNIVEINAGTFPGNPGSKPAGDTTPPTVTAFTIPSASTSLTVPITSFSATDNVGVTGYLVTETSATPAATAPGWNGTAQTSYTFTSQGVKTLYAWAKDAANNVSTSRSASVTITIPAGDTTPPTVTSFEIPAVSSSARVEILAITATDNVGVTGYLVKKSSSAPSADDAGWQPSPPASIRFSGEGVKTLYAWAKDSAGNVSQPARATVLIRLHKGESVIPVPAGEEIFSYSAVAYPMEKGNLEKTKPLGIGSLAEGGPVLDLQASIGPFDGPVDVYVTMYAPAQPGSQQPSDMFYLRPDNVFEAVTTTPKAWQQAVTDINEHITGMATTELVPGPYVLIMTVTPAGSQEHHYHWVTPFIVP